MAGAAAFLVLKNKKVETAKVWVAKLGGYQGYQSERRSLVFRKLLRLLQWQFSYDSAEILFMAYLLRP